MAAKKKLKKKAAKRKVVKRIKRKVAKRRPAKKAVRKAAKKAPARKKAAAVKKEKKGVIGSITHYFPKVQAAVIKLKAPINIGDDIKIKGHTTDFIQRITSMQIDHVPVTTAKKGEEIGLLVSSRVRQHDLVYKA